MSTPRDHSLLVQVAKPYYRENLAQADIAARLGSSRSHVSRLLTAAQERGVVETKIHERVQRDFALERQLVTRFALTDAIVASHVNEVSMRTVDRVGDLAWAWLRDQLEDGMTIAMSWGELLQAFVASVTPPVMSSTEVVQLVGGVSARASFITGQELVHEVATRHHSGRLDDAPSGGSVVMSGASWSLHEGVAGSSVHIRPKSMCSPRSGLCVTRAVRSS